MNRVFLIVLDSVGVGALPDAAQYGDQGAATLQHILDRFPLDLRHMALMGLGRIPDVSYEIPMGAAGVFGRAMEKSSGKDTTTGHWELMGIRLPQAFPTYPDGFPSEVISAFEQAIGCKTLGNVPASGTAILDELGEEHMRTGYPIVYTSADSVFQIAAHEDVVEIETLYRWCEIARGLLQGEHAVGRVIARPFAGKHAGAFERTGRRRDFSLEPIAPTLLDRMQQRGLFTMGIGKIEDIFCMRGIVKSNHAAGNRACIDSLLEAMQHDFEGLVFVNLVDFDMVNGHRRDAKGYGEALEYFDKRLAEILRYMRQEDLLLITADHGCDPTHHGTDHTREYIPILAWNPRMTQLVDIGTRQTYADVAATVSELFGMPDRFGAESFAQDILKSIE